MATIALSPDVQLSTEEARSIMLRLRVALRRDALTRELADGQDPAATAELRLRARQLTSARSRSRLANALRRAIGEVRYPSRHHGFAIVSRRSVANAVEEMDLLAKRLHSPEPVTPQGMALVARIVTDGASSPLYGSADPDALRRLVILATAALDVPDAVAAKPVAASARQARSGAGSRPGALSSPPRSRRRRAARRP